MHRTSHPRIIAVLCASALALCSALACAQPIQLNPRIQLSPAQLARLQAVANDGPDALRRYLWRTRGIYNWAWRDLV